MTYLDTLFSLKDQVAVVTGATRGLGQAMAEGLLQAGATVVLVGSNQQRLEETTRSFSAQGLPAHSYCCDLSDREQLDGLVEHVGNQHRRVDVLVNNAGVGAGKNIEEATLDEWRWVMGINLEGTFMGTQKAIAAMKKSGGGSIVNISSIEGLVGDSRMVAYDASKAGIVLLSRSAALHCAKNKYNIRVNTVHPGFINTKMVQGFLKAISGDGDVARARAELVAKHPLGHLGEPDDVAYAVLYLASEESKFATGTELVVDGGYTAQ